MNQANKHKATDDAASSSLSSLPGELREHLHIILYDFEDSHQDWTVAENKLLALLTSEIEKTEKAYGDCKICYGKGYHTKRVGTSSRLGNVTHDTIGYCTCTRGKQLESVNQEIAREAELNGLKLVIQRHAEIEAEGKTSIPLLIVANRIAELTQKPEGTHE